MNNLTLHIYNYLLELGENDVARFLEENCNIDDEYIDTLFDTIGDGQTELIRIRIYVKPKPYRDLAKYSKFVERIEAVTREVAVVDGRYVDRFEWLPDPYNALRLSVNTLDYLQKVITGDKGDTKYLSGYELVTFFNTFGFNDEYGQGFPSRWKFTLDKLKELNNQGKIRLVIERYYSPINFVENKALLTKLVSELNEYLAFDDFSISIIGKKCVLASVMTKLDTSQLMEVNHDYIRDNIEKCDKKIIEGDYSGAVTNARSLVETALLHIEEVLSGQPVKFDGDLNKLYKDVAKKLNLSIDGDTKVEAAIKRIVSGLFGVISGISELGSDLGDRHGKSSKKYKTDKHHALLVVNSTKTFTDFIFSSFEKQQSKH